MPIFDKKVKKITLRSESFEDHRPVYISNGNPIIYINASEFKKRLLTSREMESYRFIVNASGELLFTSSLVSSKDIPCITAGTVFYKNGQVTVISNNYNAFTVPFQSLQFALFEFFKAGILMSNSLEFSEKTNQVMTIHHEDTALLNYTYYQEVILDDFNDKMLALNVDNKYGDEYNGSLTEFNRSAKGTLTNPPRGQSMQESLRDLAHECFNHRHSCRRLLADALMCIFVITLAVGCIRRFALKETFFFSNATTNREDLFLPKLTNEQNQDNDEARLFPYSMD